MTPRIALLDASVGDTPAERNVRREVDADVDAYKLPDGSRPPAVSTAAWRYDGVVIGGSQTSVYDDRDWIHETTEWVRRAHAADVPTLGICWGHQFLAQALGGRVVDVGDHELGYRTVRRVGESRLLDGLPEAFTAFETHHDRVAELPPGAVTTARNEFGVQAFRRDTAHGVQFHPEYDRQTAEWVVDNKDLSADRTERVRDGITEERVAAAEPATRVFDAFVSFATAHRRGARRPH